MKNLLYLLAAVLLACSPVDNEVCLVGDLSYTAQYEVPAHELLVLEESPAHDCQPWAAQIDHTDCINGSIVYAALHGYDGVGLTRGQTYIYSDRIFTLPRTVLQAVGDSAQRPILKTHRHVTFGIFVADYSKFIELDIRGPRYNSSPFEVSWMRGEGTAIDGAYRGLNGGSRKGWEIIGTSVNGFPGTGILASQSDSIRIIGSTFAHNGFSGISIFGGEYCGVGAVVTGNLLEHNGQNGLDSCFNHAMVENNVARYNGWASNGGDMNGLLVYTPEKHTRSLRFVSNITHDNEGNGIRIVADTLSNSYFLDNISVRNVQGLSFAAELSNVSFNNNVLAENYLECKREVEGIRQNNNCCSR